MQPQKKSPSNHSIHALNRRDLHTPYMIPICFKDKGWRQADLLHNGMHTFVFILPFQLKRAGGSFVIFHQNVDVFCLHNVAGPLPQ
jgi:hypothetical protein